MLLVAMSAGNQKPTNAGDAQFPHHSEQNISGVEQIHGESQSPTYSQRTHLPSSQQYVGLEYSQAPTFHPYTDQSAMEQYNPPDALQHPDHQYTSVAYTLSHTDSSYSPAKFS